MRESIRRMPCRLRERADVLRIVRRQEAAGVARLAHAAGRAQRHERRLRAEDERVLAGEVAALEVRLVVERADEPVERSARRGGETQLLLQRIAGLAVVEIDDEMLS